MATLNCNSTGISFAQANKTSIQYNVFYSLTMSSCKRLCRDREASTSSTSSTSTSSDSTTSSDGESHRDSIMASFHPELVEQTRQFSQHHQHQLSSASVSFAENYNNLPASLRTQESAFAALMIECQDMTKAVGIWQIIHDTFPMSDALRRVFLQKLVDLDVITTSDMDCAIKYCLLDKHPTPLVVAEHTCARYLCPPVNSCVECHADLVFGSVSPSMLLWTSAGGVRCHRLITKCVSKQCGPTKLRYFPDCYKHTPVTSSGGVKMHSYYKDQTFCISGNHRNYFTLELMELYCNLQ